MLLWIGEREGTGSLGNGAPLPFSAQDRPQSARHSFLQDRIVETSQPRQRAVAIAQIIIPLYSGDSGFTMPPGPPGPPKRSAPPALTPFLAIHTPLLAVIALNIAR